MNENPVNFVGISPLTQEEINNELRNAQTVYMNGFAINPTPVDISINIIQNGHVVSILTMSAMTAKNLQKGLLTIINILENEAGIHIDDYEEVSKKFAINLTQGLISK